MSEQPELLPNQIGISCKVLNDRALKMDDEILYFTFNKNSVSLELYPKKPIIIIDKDAIKMVLNKIAELELAETEATELRSSDKFPLEAIPPKGEII